jgi:hypothetical protein
MSDNPTAYPPPPPPGLTPPSAQPAPPPPPIYQGPPAPDYVQPYLQQPQQPYPQPSPYQQPFPTAGAVAGGTGALLYQLGGPAAWSIGFGLVSIVVPFVTNYYFPILPIAGLISAVRAIQRGRLIGGVIGIVVNLIGGLVSLFASGLIGG